MSPSHQQAGWVPLDKKTSLFLESPACRAAALLQPGGAIAPKIKK